VVVVLRGCCCRCQWLVVIICVGIGIGIVVFVEFGRQHVKFIGVGIQFGRRRDHRQVQRLFRLRIL